MPIGSTSAVPEDVRIISALPRNLEEAIEHNQFREDLFYRLKVASFELPPLHERKEDIPLLAGYFIQVLLGDEKNMKSITPDAMQILVDAAWPENVRQLYNVLENAFVTATTSPLISGNFIKYKTILENALVKL